MQHLRGGRHRPVPGTPLPATYYPPPTTYYLLLTTHYSLLTLLLTTCKVCVPREKHKRRRVARTSDRQLSPGMHDDEEGHSHGVSARRPVGSVQDTNECRHHSLAWPPGAGLPCSRLHEPRGERMLACWKCPRRAATAPGAGSPCSRLRGTLVRKLLRCSAIPPPTHPVLYPPPPLSTTPPPLSTTPGPSPRARAQPVCRRGELPAHVRR